VTAPSKLNDDVLELGPLLFAEPKALAIGGAAVGLLVFGLWLDWYRRRRLTGGAVKLPVMRAMLASSSPVRRMIKAVAIVLAAIGLVIALAEPMIKKKTEVYTRGLDLVLALDVSKSMQVGDVPPSRLEQARNLVKAVLKETTGDRVAGVAFAGGAAHFPLTDDHDVTGSFLADFGPNDVPVGSDLGEAIRVSRCLLRPELSDQYGCPGTIGRRGHGGDPLPGDRYEDRDRRGDATFGPDEDDDDDYAEERLEKSERGRAIVIFTDGADDAEKAAQEVVIARQLGITVFVVGFGTEAGGEVWEVDDDGNPIRQRFDDTGKPIISKRDDRGMRTLAVASGDEGHYLIAPPTGEIDPEPVTSALSKVKRGLSSQKVRKARPVYHWFLFPAFMLLIVEALISTRRRRKTVVP
jgi:Ca-activated chloride channel family protein